MPLCDPYKGEQSVHIMEIGKLGASYRQAKSWLAGIALIGLALIIASCDSDALADKLLFYTPYHARLVVEVETPEGVKRGQSVIEVKWTFGDFAVNGEAVAVDLPDGQTLFLLLRSNYDPDWAAKLHHNIEIDMGDVPENDDDSYSSRNARKKYYYAKVAADRQIWPVHRIIEVGSEQVDNYPYFIRFRDIKDPASAEQVDPDNLAKTFGHGYKLKSLTVQMTEEPITKEIEGRLKWLTYPETPLNPDHGPKDWSLSAVLLGADFIRKGN